MRLGLTAGIAHPGRSAMTLGALVVGVAALTFTLGTNLSLVRIMTDLNRYDAAPVGADIGNTTSPDEIASTVATIAGMPETAHVVAVGRASVSVPIAGSVVFVGYDGDASWAGYVLTRGRWFAGPGEVVAPTNLFRETGLHVGDTIDVSSDQGQLHLRLVGETFDQGEEGHDGLVLRGTFADLSTLQPSATVDHVEMQPRAGISAHEYRSDVVAATNEQLPVYSVSELASDASFILFLSVVAFLGVVLVAISIGGVFNTVLLETRQRWRELAILKAIGLTPRQVLVQVVSSVLGVGLVAGVVGVPLGLVIEHVVIAYMGDTAAHLDVPASAFDVLVPVAYLGAGARAAWRSRSSGRSCRRGGRPGCGSRRCSRRSREETIKGWSARETPGKECRPGRRSGRQDTETEPVARSGDPGEVEDQASSAAVDRERRLSQHRRCIEG